MKKLIDYITESNSALQNVLDEVKKALTDSTYYSWQKALETKQSDIEYLAELVEKLPRANKDKDDCMAVIEYNYTPGGTKTNKVKIRFFDKNANFGRAGSSPLAYTYKGLMLGTHNVVMKCDDSLNGVRQRDLEFFKIDKDFVKDIMDKYEKEFADKKE